MGSQGKKWIVRDASGHIYGPFELEKLAELLTKRILSGEEQVAEYPAGDWAPMSAIREVYDIVLEALAQPSTAPRKKETTKPVSGKQEIREATRFKKAFGETRTRKLSDTEALPSEDDDKPGVVFSKPLNVASSSAGQPSADIELSDKKKIIRRKGNLIPLILLIFSVLLVIFALQQSDLRSKKKKAINLIMPQPKSKGDPAKAQAYLQKGWNHFYRDTFSNYVRAQEAFVAAVEESPSNTDALVMLIMTDLELWPFSKQDSKDQNILRNLLQMVSKADTYGPKRSIASAMVDLMLGRDSSARSQIDSSLVTQPTEGRLYALKAQLFFESSDLQQAVPYFEKTVSLMPYWVKPLYMLGLSFSRQGKPEVAQEFLIRALKINSSHPAARLELGILEAQYFNHDDKAREYLTVALDSDERLLPPIEARGRYFLAILLNKAGERSRARKEAEYAARLNPTDPDIKEFLVRVGDKRGLKESPGDDRQHMVLGDQYMRSSNYLAAQAQFKAAFASNPKNARAALRAGEALWNLHQASEAIEYLQKAIASDPKLVDSYVVLADFRSQRYDFEGATRTLEMALKVNARNYEIYRGYAEIFLRKGDAASAEVYSTRALQLYETDVRSNRIMARIQLARRNIPKAVQYSKRAIELDRSNVDAQVDYSKVLASYEGVKAAEEYLKDLVNTYPTQLPYRIGLAEILIQDEQYAVAKDILGQVVGADDRNRDAYLLLGDAHFFANNLDEALNSYLAAVRVDPSDPSGLFRAGEVYLKAGKYSEAQKQFELVLKINSLYPRTHYSLARVYFSQGEGDLALKELEEEKRRNPRLADPYEFAGDILVASRKYSLATREYQKASSLRPQGVGIYVKLAKAYRGQGSFDAALAMLRLAAAKESGFAEIYREQGSLYEVKGMPQEAVLAYQRYLRLEPNPPDKEAILGKIKELE
jgi:tetratricopeptide (TPR) repeat protein